MKQIILNLVEVNHKGEGTIVLANLASSIPLFCNGITVCSTPPGDSLQ